MRFWVRRTDPVNVMATGPAGRIVAGPAAFDRLEILVSTDTKDILDTVPTGSRLSVDDRAAAIDACLRCLQSCSTCADADLLEKDVDEMRRCIALCVDCADVCGVTARLLSRSGQSDELVLLHLLQACVRVCENCAEECARHAHHHRHCAICERHCRTCAEACRALLDGETLQALQRSAGA